MRKLLLFSCFLFLGLVTACSESNGQKVVTLDGFESEMKAFVDSYLQALASSDVDFQKGDYETEQEYHNRLIEQVDAEASDENSELSTTIKKNHGIYMIKFQPKSVKYSPEFETASAYPPRLGLPKIKIYKYTDSYTSAIHLTLAEGSHSDRLQVALPSVRIKMPKKMAKDLDIINNIGEFEAVFSLRFSKENGDSMIIAPHASLEELRWKQSDKTLWEWDGEKTTTISASEHLLNVIDAITKIRS